MCIVRFRSAFNMVLASYLWKIVRVEFAIWLVPLSLHCRNALRECRERIQRAPNFVCRYVWVHHHATDTIRNEHEPHALDFHICDNTMVRSVQLRCHSMPDARQPYNFGHHSKRADFLATHARRNIHNIHRPSPSFLSPTYRHSRTDENCKHRTHFVQKGGKIEWNELTKSTNKKKSWSIIVWRHCQRYILLVVFNFQSHLHLMIYLLKKLCIRLVFWHKMWVTWIGSKNISLFFFTLCSVYGLIQYALNEFRFFGNWINQLEKII